MSYIGRNIENLSDRAVLDSISTSATATFNLLLNSVAYVPSSAESLTVSLNGVIQAPQSSYTVSGSTIIFASSLQNSDVIDFILAERAITLTTIGSGTVTTSNIVDANVTTAKIADNAVTTAKLASGLLPTNTPAFGAKRSNAQTANQDTWTKIDFDTEIYDSDGKFDISNDRFTPTVAGTYIIYGQLANNNLYNQAYLQVAIYKNGSLLIESEIIGNNSTSNRNYTVNVNLIDVADTDDYYELYGKQGLGGGVAITEASRNIFLGYKIT